MKIIKRIFFLISLFVLYLIFKELLFLYGQIKNIHPVASYIFLSLLGGFWIYFILLPVIKILILPKNLGPVTNPQKELNLIRSRIERFRKNKYLQSINFDFSGITNDKKG